jgi:hypothetical protein
MCGNDGNNAVPRKGLRGMALEHTGITPVGHSIYVEYIPVVY